MRLFVVVEKGDKKYLDTQHTFNYTSWLWYMLHIAKCCAFKELDESYDGSFSYHLWMDWVILSSNDIQTTLILNIKHQCFDKHKKIYYFFLSLVNCSIVCSLLYYIKSSLPFLQFVYINVAFCQFYANGLTLSNRMNDFHPSVISDKIYTRAGDMTIISILFIATSFPGCMILNYITKVNTSYKKRFEFYRIKTFHKLRLLYTNKTRKTTFI